MTVRMHCLFCHVIKGWIIFGGLSVISGFFRVDVIPDESQDARSIPGYFYPGEASTVICKTELPHGGYKESMDISGIV